MTAPVGIRQSQIEAALRALKRTGVQSARLLLDLDRRQIEIRIGEGCDPPEPNDWDNELIGDS